MPRCSFAAVSSSRCRVAGGGLGARRPAGDGRRRGERTAEDRALRRRGPGRAVHRPIRGRRGRGRRRAGDGGKTALAERRDPARRNRRGVRRGPDVADAAVRGAAAPRLAGAAPLRRARRPGAGGRSVRLRPAGRQPPVRQPRGDHGGHGGPPQHAPRGRVPQAGRGVEPAPGPPRRPAGRRLDRPRRLAAALRPGRVRQPRQRAFRLAPARRGGAVGHGAGRGIGTALLEHGRLPRHGTARAPGPGVPRPRHPASGFFPGARTRGRHRPDRHLGRRGRARRQRPVRDAGPPRGHGPRGGLPRLLGPPVEPLPRLHAGRRPRGGLAVPGGGRIAGRPGSAPS